MCIKSQKTLNSQSNLGKENGAGEIRLTDFRLYYKAIVIETVWYWHKTKNIDQLNRTESPEINPHTYGQLIYEKIIKTINGGKTVSSTNSAGKTGQLHIKNEIRTFFNTIHTKISSKLIKYLNRRTDTIKLIEENRGRTFSDINHSNIFFNQALRVMEINGK